MKQKIRLGDCYALAKHKLDQLNIKYFSLVAVLTIMCLYARARQQETFTVTGKVISAASGAAIEGATITNKRSRVHAVTDQRGEYRISARPDDILIYSFVGYASAEEEISGREKIIVALDSAENTLEEVEINAGYYTTTRRTSTGNISRVTAEEIERQPVTNVLGALIGRMPGVSIVQQSGMPGGSFGIKIRGRNSLRQDGNDPLYIINGVPFSTVSLSTVSDNPLAGGSPLSAINPADITSIEVLKDADATAIYGSRGANGVVLITTKHAASGKTSVEASAYLGTAHVANRMRLLNTHEYLEMRREAIANVGESPSLSILSFGYAPDLLSWDTTRYTDWQDVLAGENASTSNVSVAINGGGPNSNFRIGLGNFTETPVTPGHFQYTKRSVDLGGNLHSPNQRLWVALATNYSVESNNLASGDALFRAFLLAPNSPEIYDEDGLLNRSWANPFLELEKEYTGETHQLNANGTVTYELFRGFRLKGSFGYSRVLLNQQSTVPISSMRLITPTTTGSIVEGYHHISSWIAEPQMNYRRSFGRSNINALVGAAAQGRTAEQRSLQATGIYNDALLNNIQAASAFTIQNSNFSDYRYAALFGRLNYRFDGKYIINLTGRRDGSSRFGKGKRFASFGAVGIAWLFSEEPFIQELMPFVSFGKLRGSYGITGSDQIADYGYLDSYRTTPYRYANIPGLIPARIANPDYSWEMNRKLEIAAEFGLVNDRISLGIAWYNNRSSNQLVGYPLTPTTGFASLQYNLPAEVLNTGWEVEASTENVKAGRFRWATYANLSIPRNELLSYPGLASSSFANTYEEGAPLDIKKLYRFIGVNEETGFYKVEDRDSNGVYDDADLVIVPFGQRFFGGIGNHIEYKNVYLDFHVQFVRQRGYNFFASGSMPGIINNNQPVSVLNRWQKKYDHTTIQRYEIKDQQAFNLARRSDRVVGDASFLRLKNISLGYRLPRNWSESLFLRQLEVFLLGQNLFTLTRYNGMDPETQSLNVPPLRTLTGGIRLSF